MDHKTNQLSVEYFDRIFVCNGHYTKPQYPDIPGMDIYRGLQMHSHLYRSAERFQGKLEYTLKLSGLKSTEFLRI